MNINSTSEGLHHPSFKSLVSPKKNLVPRSGPERSTNSNNSANSKQNSKKGSKVNKGPNGVD
jgi:hypothetical protein